MIGAAKKIRSEIRFQRNRKKGNIKNLGDPHWLCNNATLQGSSTIPLTTTINSPQSRTPQQCFPTLKLSLSFHFQDLQSYLSPIVPASQWFHGLPLRLSHHQILHHGCLTHHHLLLVSNLPALPLVLYPTIHSMTS